MPSPQNNIKTKFTLSPSEQNLLSRYYIIYWRREYLFETFKDSPYITHQEHNYIPVLASPPHEIMSCEEVRISFRKEKNAEIGYAIIKTSTKLPNYSKE
jgi:hypothetical protein